MAACNVDQRVVIHHTMDIPHSIQRNGNATHLELNCGTNTESVVALTQGLPHVRSVTFTYLTVNEDVLTALASWTYLEEFIFRGEFGAHSLFEITAVARALPLLQVFVSKFRGTAPLQCIPALQEALPNLRSLTLKVEWTDEQIAQIVTAFPALETLEGKSVALTREYLVQHHPTLPPLPGAAPPTPIPTSTPAPAPAQAPAAHPEIMTIIMDMQAEMSRMRRQIADLQQATSSSPASSSVPTSASSTARDREMLESELLVARADVQEAEARAARAEARLAELEDALCCPITHDIFDDPVITPEGFSYSRTGLESFLSQQGIDPQTRTPLTVQDLVPNRSLQTICSTFTTHQH